MKRFFTFITSIISLSIISQDGSYSDAYTITYKASDMNYKGKVKSVTEEQSKLNDQNLLQKGITYWHKTNTTRLNFNENGNLISCYKVSNNNDTNEIKILNYNNLNQLVEINAYYTSYGKTCNTTDLSNWTNDQTNFKYKSGKLIEATYKGESFHKYGNSRLAISYDSYGRMVQKIVTSTDEKLDTLYLNDYNYIGNSDKIAQLIVSHCEKRASGATTFNYNIDSVLVSKQFTPETYELKQPWDSEEKFWKFDNEGNCTEVVLGDSLKWPVYIYDISTYNTKNDVKSHISILDYDGIGHSQFSNEYSYDQHDNWTEKKIRVQILREYGYGETGSPDEFYKVERNITYFDE